MEMATETVCKPHVEVFEEAMRVERWE